jgi:hypothetical protein
MIWTYRYSRDGLIVEQLKSRCDSGRLVLESCGDRRGVLSINGYYQRCHLRHGQAASYVSMVRKLVEYVCVNSLQANTHSAATRKGPEPPIH